MAASDDLLLQYEEQRAAGAPAAGATPGVSASDALLDARVQQRSAALDATLRQAVPVNPDAAAKATNLAAKTGLPVDVVDRNVEQINTVERVKQMRATMAQSPILERQMLDPQFAKIAHDSVENLSGVERALTWLRDDLRNVPGKNVAAVARSVREMSGGLWGYGLEMPADLVARYVAKPILGADNRIADLAEFARGKRKSEQNVAAEIAKYWNLDDKSAYLATQYYNALGSVWQSIATLPAALETAIAKTLPSAAKSMMQAAQDVPLSAMAPMMMSQGGQSYGKARDQGVDPLRAAAYATSDAAVEGLTERIGLGRFVHDMKVGDPIWKILAHQVAAQNVGEFFATHLQDLNAWAALPENKAKTFGDYMRERPEATLDTIIQTTMATVIQTGAMSMASARTRRTAEEVQAAKTEETLRNLMALAAADKTRERTPAEFAGFVQNVADAHGTPNMFIDAATFLQAAQEKGLDIAATMPQTAARLQEALTLQGDVAIPVGELATALPGTGLENVLLQHMRPVPGADTLAETQDTARAQETEAAVAKILDEHNFNDALKESAATVEKELLAQLNQANRFTPDVNAAKAKIVAAFYATMGARVGKTAEEMYTRYALRVGRDDVGAGVMDQRERVKQLIIQHNLTEENLAHMVRMGGLPVPSLAITKAKDAMTNFGEITLLGHKDMADPKGYARTRVFGADIYSPRYPNIHYKIDVKGERKLEDMLAPFNDVVGEKYIDIDSLQKNGAEYLQGNARVMAAFLASRGVDLSVLPKIPDTPGYNNYSERYAVIEQMRKVIEQANLIEEFNNYTNRLMREAGATERIFKGFTYSGKRRYVPHTLETVVKILKKELRGGETPGNLYGIGQLRAKFTPQFRTITAIREAHERLTDKDNFEQVKNEIDGAFFAIVDALKPYYTHDFNSFRFADTVMSMIEDGARKGLNYAAREYGFDEIPDDVRLQIVQFVTHLRNMPTEYFEAKILREVALSEFVAAVVPHNVGDSTIEALQRHGVRVIKYNYAHGSEIERKAAIEQAANEFADNVMFQDTIDNDTGAVDKAPWFYSELAKQVDGLKMKVAPAAQWKAAILALANKGVKKDEMEWSGVLDWLDMLESTSNEPRFVAVNDKGERVGDEVTPEGREKLVALADGVHMTLHGKGFAEALRDAGVPNTLVVAQLTTRVRAAMARGELTDKALEDIHNELQEKYSANGDLLDNLTNGMRALYYDKANVRLESTAVVPLKFEEVKRSPNRVTKEEVQQFLAANGVSPVTRIMGEEPNTTEKVRVVQTSGGYSVVEVDGAFQLRDSDNRRSPNMTEEGALRMLADATSLPLPPGYTIEERDGEFYVNNDDGEDVGEAHETRAAAVDTAREDYVDRAVDPEDFDDDMLRERAEELMREDIPEMAHNYARDSDSSSRAYNVALLPPEFKVVKVEGDGGVADMFTGQSRATHWRVVPVAFNNLPDDDAVDIYSSSRGRAQANMPDDIDEFWELFSEHEELGEPEGPEFATAAEAEAWGEANVGRSAPAWVPWDSDESGGPGDAYHGEHEDFDDAVRAAERANEQNFESEVEYYLYEHEWDVDNYPRYFERARDEMTDEDGRDARLQQIAHPNPPRLKAAPRLVNPVKYPDRYVTKETRDKRELLISLPNIEPYNENDSTHYGPETEGRVVVWARIGVVDDANGVPTLLIDENQSQRGQHGLEKGFKNPNAQEEYNAITAVIDAQHALIRNLEAAERQALEHMQQGPDDEFGTHAVVVTRAREDLTRAYNDLDVLQDQRNTLRNNASNVPSAPFVTDTKAWTVLGFKRAVHYAVEHGITQIAWTTGAQNALRYGTQSEIDKLVWEKKEGGIYVVAFKDGKQVVDKLLGTDEMPSHIGARVATKIINDPDQSGEIPSSDLDAINGLGMLKYYGDSKGRGPDGKPSIMSIAASQIFKEVKGGKIETIDVTLSESNKNVGEFRGAPGFKITDEMKAQIERGFKLFQNKNGARGQISFASDIKSRPSVITLLANADLSTFLHESGHFYLEVLADMASDPAAPKGIVDDFNAIMRWFNVPNRDVWNAMTLEQKRPYHEQFARGFEAYLFEGRSPSTELNGLFGKFRAWMLNVYKSLLALNVTLTPEVRGVFDRMLATNDEILDAESARSFVASFKTAEEMGATTAEWEAYQQQQQDATQTAVDMLQTRSLRDMKWLANARNRTIKALQRSAAKQRKAVRAEVEAEVQAQPVYAALRFLTRGELAEGNRNNKQRTILDSFAGLDTKLSLPDLRRMYGDGPAAPWRYLNTGKFGSVTAEDGLDPNMVAELFGFSSGDHMVREILAAEPEASVVEGMTDQRMLERYGDLNSPEAIERAADEAVHNEMRAKVLATELSALTKATGTPKTLLKAAREFAATIIARKKIRDIHPAQYAAAEARAGRAALKALQPEAPSGGGKEGPRTEPGRKTGDLVKAATHKRDQIVNFYATKEAYGALKSIEKGVAYLKKVGASKSVDREYLEQIQALLERFDLRQVSNAEVAKRESLVQWVEEQRARGLEPVIDDALLNEANRKPYRELTVEEFRGLVDAVRNIEHLGRLKKKLLDARDRREFAAIVAEAAASIDAHAKRTVPTQLERNTWTARMKEGVAEWFAMHRKFAFIVREMDGHADNGVLWNLFVRRMNEAGDREAVMREKATIELSELMQPILKLGKFSEKKFIPEINASLSREGRIMVALNTGTEGNLQRLMDGDRWTDKQVQAIVNTLSKTEMDFVASIWKFVGQYRAQIGEQQKRITGIEPKWVEGRIVKTKWGDYQGGYIPAKYDTTRSTRALADEAAAGILDQWRAARGAAKTRDSFTKKRADKVVDRALRKDFGVITGHVTEVTHRLAWQEYLIDAQRLLRAGPIDAAIREHYGHETLKALRDTIEDAAAGEIGAQNAFERAVNYLRTGATIAGMGWRLTTSLLQPIGLTQSMVRIGPKWVARGMAEWLGTAAQMESATKRIFDKSDMMRLRAKTMQREISEIRNTVSGSNSAIEASYFYMIQKMQMVADIPTWLGQYEKSIDAGLAEDKAVALADQAVLDAQGGGQLKDLAAIQRGGPMMKLFTNFYSFFNTTYNLTSDVVRRTDFRNPLSVGMMAVDFLLLYSVPAALGTLLKAALHSGDDDAEDKLLRQLIADQLTYLFGTMVGLREMAGAIQTAAGLPGDYQGPASVRFFVELAKLGKQISQGEIDEALLKAGAGVGGVLFHLPSGQVAATLDGVVTMAEGKTSNPGALIVGSNKQ